MVLLFTPIALSAQEALVIKGRILSSHDGRGLPYVNIGILGTSSGTVTDIMGHYELHVSDGILEESIIRISSIGYKSKDYTLASLRLLVDGIIKLEKASYTLNAIEVKPELEKIKEVGHDKVITKKSTNFAITKKPGQNLGAAIGRRFNIGRKTSLLSKFSFYVSANNFDTIKFRVLVYSINKNRPDHVLNKSDIIIEIADHKRGWIDIDLSGYQIYASQNVIVVVEWVGHSEEGSVLQLPITIPTMGTHFYKYGSQDKWRRFRGMSSAMILTVNQ